MNNYEWIKKMSLDDMSYFFAEKIQCRCCFLPNCPEDKDCEDIFKDWLKQDFKGD